ncbi:ATP-binding domain-containing protein [Nocardioides sp. LS1]|uniref:HelD family protein n=1 Tax=Nocardioides sp. LS1 TaxID=1027620 RepID=UPI000F623A43|nr:ATP-binding domain-containing protein [Nocardioides sp. LS1]GCD90820.1 DNA helicase [Nocardioides sp. LS1]
MSADPPVDPELLAEQAHLAESRRQLTRMRERTESMDSAAAGDWVSREYLESTFALRMKQLADDPTIPLFFGRLDFGSDDGESFHIGRRHISDPSGEPMVIDWRAPVSLPFYRASRTEPMGVGLRRRYGYQHGRLTAYEDEDLAGGEAEDYSAILEAEIERPRVGPMRDIVATIQPEQDVIVRSDLSLSICVQGAPGTGKTAVGLHRAAFLLYAHREQLTRQGVLVVGPNASFLRYIRDVLPALGEIDAKQATIEELVSERRPVRGEDSAAVATLKGDARMAEVLHRALWSHLRPPTEGLVVPRGARRWRVASYEAEELVASLRARGVRYGAARAMVPQSLAHQVLVRMELAGDSPDDRVQNAVARSKPVKDYANQLWPAVDPARLVHRLLADAGFLAAAADGILDADEQAALLWDRPSKAPGSARWSLADTVLLDEAADLVERTPSVAHIVADEAQDLSPMMLRALARRSSTGSLTVLGDLAQATTPWATRSWAEALGHLGKPDAHIEQLTRGFRVPGEVIEYAARLLPHIAPDLEPPTSVRRSRGDLEVVDRDPVEAVRAAVAREGSVGLIVPDAAVSSLAAALGEAGIVHTLLGEEGDVDAHLDLVPASLAKGLEFDHVVLVEPEAIVAGEHDRVTGLRRLYVCLTRAVTSLVVCHTQPLPEELGAPALQDS